MSVREHHRTTGKNEQCIKIGDVVLVHDDIPRARWKMAVVEQLIRGKDGYARAANIRYSEGKTNRPIAKLYPLELSSTNNTNEQHVTANKTNSDDVCQSSMELITSTCPTRHSATMA